MGFTPMKSHRQISEQMRLILSPQWQLTGKIVNFRFKNEKLRQQDLNLGPPDLHANALQTGISDERPESLLH